MRLNERLQVVTIGDRSVSMRRTEGGVAEIRADDEEALAAGLGWAHAHDRLVQMELLRLVGQGRLSECLSANAQTEEIDVAMRQLGMWRDASRDVANLEPDTRHVAEAYATGVNAYLARHRRPLELLLVRHRPEPWTVADTLLTIKLMSYVGLAQTQQDIEQAIIEALHGGVPVEPLRKLFAPHLDGLDDELISLLSEVRLERPLLPETVRFLVPELRASNNWAVAGSRSESGAPLQCSDPHLECNRLPAIWYEAVLYTGDDARVGITMPGVPGVVMGRTRSLSFGFTYGFMDLIDYFVEEVRDGCCRRGDDFEVLERRSELVQRRGGSPIPVTIWESRHGVLETETAREQLPDGYYLCRAWSCHRDGAAASLDAICQLPQARTVPEAQSILARVTISCNWLLADRDGHIGYQQSGRLPLRAHSGLHPVPGWEQRWDWRGVADPESLARVLDPPDGLLVTANEDHNPDGGPLAVNLSMGPYRAERIRALLDGEEPLTIERMQQVQNDLYSVQAERFMAMLEPLLPSSAASSLLTGWDRCYDVASRGATLFERVYHAVLRRVFGDGLFGREAWDEIVATTSVVTDYYERFDRALLADEPWCYGDPGREAVLREVLDEVLDGLDPATVEPWGEVRQVMMTNVFFAGRLPRWLGFDHGPVQLPGSRATIVQGGIFQVHGRLSTFAPSWRYCTDLGEDEVHTALAGGPSGRRFSRHYTTDVERWLSGQYKTLGF